MKEVESVDWKEFFDAHAPHYDENAFTQNTKVECQFLREVMGLKPDMVLLDAGCGTGRHSIEFAKYGMRVMGVDISKGMLDIAKKKAEVERVDVHWVEADLTKWSNEPIFDAAICLCEGGLGLASRGEEPVQHDLAILKNIAGAMKTGAPLVITALNGYSVIRRMKDEDIEKGSFNPGTMMLFYADEWVLPEGTKEMYLQERLFIPPEFVAMLHHAGFRVRNIWGGTAGDWGQRPLKLDEIEAMYVCEKV
jgi:SAM-dependent methyltransferase